jgi:hypothetical protein
VHAALGILNEADMRVLVQVTLIAFTMAIVAQTARTDLPLPSVSTQEATLDEQSVSVALYDRQQDFITFSRVEKAPDELLRWRESCISTIIEKLESRKEDVAGLKILFKSNKLYTTQLKDGGHIVVPCYVQRVLYKNKKAWLVISNWEMYLEQYKGSQSLGHILLLIVGMDDGKIIDSDQCS